MRFCPICGRRPKSGESLDAVPGGGVPQHRCDPAYLRRRDAAIAVETTAVPPLTYSERLSVGFALLNREGH